MKVAHSLGKVGVLANVWSKGEGRELAAAADSINLGPVVCMTEGAPHRAERFDPVANACCITPASKLRTVLDDAVRAFYAVLRYLLDNIARNANVLAKILSMPRPARSRGAA